MEKEETDDKGAYVEEEVWRKAASASPGTTLGKRVAKEKVGVTVQAMISLEGATHVDAVEFDATTFTVTRLA